MTSRSLVLDTKGLSRPARSRPDHGHRWLDAHSPRQPMVDRWLDLHQPVSVGSLATGDEVRRVSTAAADLVREATREHAGDWVATVTNPVRDAAEEHECEGGWLDVEIAEEQVTGHRRRTRGPVAAIGRARSPSRGQGLFVARGTPDHCAHHFIATACDD